MADSTVSALTASAALDGTELYYAVQAGGDTKVTGTKIRKFASTYYNVQDYGWLPDSTDHSVEALALLATVSAAGGGTLFFPASTGKYRADSQLFIPNDNASIPTQANFRFTGAGGGALWGDAGRTQKGAAVLDLRYTAVDGNAKIETRGSGALVIDNLTLFDGAAANATPFIHTTNTTLTIRGNTFIGSGSATQDAIVLGGATDITPGKIVTSPYQGYGSIIDNNHFRNLNRGVYGRTFANSVVVTNNSWLASAGTIAIEFSCSVNTNYALHVTGNLIEMTSPMIYGIKLSNVQNSFFANNAFWDAGGAYLSDYRFDATGGVVAGNTFVKGLSGGTAFSQTGNVTQLSLQTYISADGGNNPFADGVASSLMAKGLEVQGSYTAANHASGILNLRDQFAPDELFNFGADTSGRYIDSWSAAGFWRNLSINPRGGPTLVNGPFRKKPTALTLSNGLNSDVVLWASDSTNKSSYIRVSGPTGAFSLGGMKNTAAAPSLSGSELTIYNSTSQQMTIVNADASSVAGNRILTMTGGNVVLRSGTSTANFIYDDTDSRWILTSSN